MKNTRKYTSEFREEAVNLALRSDESGSVIASELGISKGTLYKWIRVRMGKRTNIDDNNSNGRIGKVVSIGSKTYKDLEEENKSLKKQLRRAEEEREILKKAAAYFANQEQ